MFQTITLELPGDVGRVLQQEAARTEKSPEEVALEWVGSHVETQRGSAYALTSTQGSWSMAADERERIERMIEEERILAEEHQRHCVRIQPFYPVRMRTVCRRTRI